LRNTTSVAAITPGHGRRAARAWPTNIATVSVTGSMQPHSQKNVYSWPLASRSKRLHDSANPRVHLTRHVSGCAKGRRHALGAFCANVV
jgi:hypothetical protein